MGGTCIPSENYGADMELKRLFEEPYAGKPHVRFREGRTEKSDSVYSTGIGGFAADFDVYDWSHWHGAASF